MQPKFKVVVKLLRAEHCMLNIAYIENTYSSGITNEQYLVSDERQWRIILPINTMYRLKRKLDVELRSQTRRSDCEEYLRSGRNIMVFAGVSIDNYHFRSATITLLIGITKSHVRHCYSFGGGPAGGFGLVSVV